MANRVEVLEFHVMDTHVVVEQMDRLGEAHSGWVNLRPALRPEEELERPSGLEALFAVSVHQVPICTWVAGKASRHGVEPDSLGVQHAAGTKAVVQLREAGVPLPEGWRSVQDHPRRGIVVRAPPGTDHSEELTWLLRAGTLLSQVPLRGEWLCEVHSRA
jgi:hypothetical protein